MSGVSKCVKRCYPVLWTEKKFNPRLYKGVDVAQQWMLQGGNQKTGVSVSIIYFRAGLKLLCVQEWSANPFYCIYCINRQLPFTPHSTDSSLGFSRNWSVNYSRWGWRLCWNDHTIHHHHHHPQSWALKTPELTAGPAGSSSWGWNKAIWQ